MPSSPACTITRRRDREDERRLSAPRRIGVRPTDRLGRTARGSMRYRIYRRPRNIRESMTRDFDWEVFLRRSTETSR